jgi:hypothetical protein
LAPVQPRPDAGAAHGRRRSNRLPLLHAAAVGLSKRLKQRQRRRRSPRRRHAPRGAGLERGAQVLKPGRRQREEGQQARPLAAQQRVPGGLRRRGARAGRVRSPALRRERRGLQGRCVVRRAAPGWRRARGRSRPGAAPGPAAPAAGRRRPSAARPGCVTRHGSSHGPGGGSQCATAHTNTRVSLGLRPPPPPPQARPRQFISPPWSSWLLSERAPSLRIRDLPPPGVPCAVGCRTIP